MKNLNKPGIFLIIIFLVTMVLLNGNVIASKVNDFYFKAITIAGNNLETDSPAFQKHYNLSMKSALHPKMAPNFNIPGGKNKSKVKTYYAEDGGESGSGGDGSGDGGGDGSGEGDGTGDDSGEGDDGSYSSKCSGGDDTAVTDAQNAVTDAQNALSEANSALAGAKTTGSPEAIAAAQQAVAAAQQSLTEAQNTYASVVARSQANQNASQAAAANNKQAQQKTNTPVNGEDPVKIATGVFTTGETDLDYKSGIFTIAVKRNYYSDRTWSHSFGPGWNFNYDTRIVMGVKPNAEEEAQSFESKYNFAWQNYQQRLAAYQQNLSVMDAALQKAQIALSEANSSLSEAQYAVSKANSSGSSSLISQANSLKEQAESLYDEAYNFYITISTTRQSLLNSYTKIEELHQVALQLKGMAEQSRREANLAAANQGKNIYVFNNTDPDYQMYGGNNVLTLIDEDGVPHLYRIDTPPDYASKTKYQNGDTNYFPNGAFLTAALPTDDKVELLVDGSYRVTRKDKTIYTYNYYGQLTGIADLNGNKLSFSYSANHELIKITDDYNRTLTIGRSGGKITSITDPKGRTYSYSYDSGGMLAGRTDADNATVGYLYDGNLLVENTKPDGSSYKFHYIDLDGKKVVDYTESEEGNRETFTYNPTGMYSEYSNASGILERHYYNERYLETKIEYPDGSFKEMAYDNNDNLISYRNELGQVFRYSYDQNRNLIQAVDPEGKTESWSYNEFNKISSYVDKLGNTTSYNYDGKGNLISVNLPDGSTVGYAYDGRGRVTGVTDQLQNKTVYSYDAYGYVSMVKDPLGNEEKFVNDPVGNILKYTDQAGNTTSYEYNGDNSITKVTDTLGKTQEYAYNIRKDLTQVVDQNGNITKLEYDKGHLLRKVTNPLGEVTEYRYRGDRKLVEKIVNGINHYSYTYDQRGNLATETQVETGTVTQYEYDPAGQLTAKVDPNGNRTEYGYNALGSLKWVKDPLGNIRNFEYNANQKVIAVTDECGNTTNFEYDRLNRLVKVTDPYRNTIQYNYDLKGNLIAVTDKNGNQSRYEYDQMGRLIKAIDPLDNSEEWKYDPRGLVTTKIDKKGNKTGYEYNGLQRLTKVTDPLNGVKQFTYDPAGNLLSLTDENGVKTTFNYDALNRLIAEINAKGNQTKYEYNYLGLVARKIDALNQVIAYEYDQLGRLVKVTDAIGAVQSFEYDKNSNLIKATDQLGNNTVYGYDALNRLAEEVNALNEKTSYQYDPKGNLVKMTNPKGDIYSYEYDALDRVTKETNFLGAIKSNSFDPNGNLTAQVDFNGNQIGYIYDKLNRLTEVNFPDGAKKSFSYDVLGNLASAVNNTADERFYYDELSRLVKAETRGLIENEVKQVEFSYDKIGNPTAISTSVEDNKARKTSYLYDELNRLAKVTLPDGGKVEFKYDALSRVIERINANGTETEYTYTSRSEVESIVNYQDRRHGPDRVIGSYGYIYNAKGQRIYQIEGDGNLTAYIYDPAGRIKEVYYPFADKKKVEDYKERFYYGLLPDYDGPCKFRLNIPNLYWDEQASLNDQVRELYDSFNKDFDDDKNNNGKHRGEKEVEVTKGENGAPFVSRIDLDYQNRNRIDEMYRKVRGGHGYLDLYKGFWKEEYSYDPNGNITQKKNGWGEINYEYNQANQLQQAGNRKYQYDPNGNTIQEVLGKYKIDYIYNYENRLVKASSQYKHRFSHWPVEGEVSFGYDALGRMVKKELNPAHGPKNDVETEYYIYNGLGLDILADYKYQTKQYGRFGQRGELDGVNEYYYGNGLLLASKKFNGSEKGHWGWDRDPLKEVFFYHQDVLGSVVMLTDSNGQVEERYQYDVWGKAYDGKFADGFPGCGQSDNVYGFTGQRFQAELGVYSFPYRDYNSRTMRWLTEDPVKDGMNWYNYCGNNPINFIDPLGLCKEGQQTIEPGHAFETYYTKLTYGIAEIDGYLYGQIASVRTEVSGIVNVNAKGDNVTVNVNINIGATSSFTQESGIAVESHVNATVTVKGENGSVVESKSFYVGSTEAKAPGTSPEITYDSGTNKSMNFTVPNGTKGNLTVEVSVKGSFGNADGGSIVVPRTYGGVVETVEVNRQ